MKLYWLESADHEHDWFVIAKDRTVARWYFSHTLGYDSFFDEVKAREVMMSPSVLEEKELGFASESVLIEGGADIIVFTEQDILSHENQSGLMQLACGVRVVTIGKEVFVEGCGAPLSVREQSVYESIT